MQNKGSHLMEYSRAMLVTARVAILLFKLLWPACYNRHSSMLLCRGQLFISLIIQVSFKYSYHQKKAQEPEGFHLSCTKQGQRGCCLTGLSTIKLCLISAISDCTTGREKSMHGHQCPPKRSPQLKENEKKNYSLTQESFLWWDLGPEYNFPGLF